ncbi:hypothetical protein [Brevibacillus dissolubilis]|uniref:hypothetical protein n=1 Tax=Brevibacillus dissolubilis TaxID=1844116 RepID=UPI0011176CE6|nr:hypothetical protein [Brevibacillus dissolubilis]
MKLQDVIYNWLQIRVVAEARPDDRSAQETEQFFHSILKEDHQVNEVAHAKVEDVYAVHYTIGEEEHTVTFDAEVIDSLLDAIQDEPKYQ